MYTENLKEIGGALAGEHIDTENHKLND